MIPLEVGVWKLASVKLLEQLLCLQERRDEEAISGFLTPVLQYTLMRSNQISHTPCWAHRSDHSTSGQPTNRQCQALQVSFQRPG